jgi:methylated-DNA-protein-cysteine methyltransferase-like protein
MPFSSPPNPKAFAEQVYRICRAIPAGKVMTYGQIARLIPPPGTLEPDQYLRLAPRWVGNAMAHCPDDVPWQRVINSQGKVSPRPGMGPLAQRQLLANEDVTFDSRDRVDLKRYAWEPDPAWLQANGLVRWDSVDPAPGPGEQRRLF